MKQEIETKNIDICHLDYFVGTLATAYKGAITSLVAKDFCMSDSGDATTFTGTILSMPVGEYEASLNRSGIELARSGLRRGYFEIMADRRRIAAARDLQIDIIQSGRHIGTFLLRKESAGGLYISAVELSAELAGIDLTRLTIPLRDKIGLLQNGEEIVAQIHSTKKDWSAFSEKLNGFSLDIFWGVRDAFYEVFDILVRFALLAAERAGSGGSNKPLSNYFDLLDLPLANEPDRSRLRPPAERWLSALSQSSIDLSPLAHRVAATFQNIRKKLPDIELGGALPLLIKSLKGRSASLQFLDDAILEPLNALIPEQDRALLSRFGEPGKRRMLEKLAEAEVRLDKGEPDQTLDEIASIDPDILDEGKAVSALFDIAEVDLSVSSIDAFSAIIAVLFSMADRLSNRTLEALGMRIPGTLERVIALGRPDVCAALLRSIMSDGSPLRERIMLDPRIAKIILSSGQSPLVAHYKEDLKQIVIPAARVRGISPDTWAEVIDPLHLERLTGFMEILMMGDEQLEDVLVHAIANLSIGGVLIPDDRLFQRRITAYLNSHALSGRFLLNYLLLERLPVYFNEVGATSRIRDDSTGIDSWGNDPVIYFLRKQVHVNASSHNVRLIEHIIKSWVQNDPSLLKDVVPPDIYSHVDVKLLERYASVIQRFFTSAGVQDAEGLHLDRLLAIADETIDDRLKDAVQDNDAEAREKVRLLCRLYKETVRKYSLISRDSEAGDVHTRLSDLIISLRGSKRVVLSPERTEPQESLYFKRHIAFGIPSVLGTYHEPKFDALTGMMRIGETIPVLLEAVISGIEQKGRAATERDHRMWFDALGEGWEVLNLYGMKNVRIDEFIDVLNHNRLHLSQIIDVLAMWQKELAWMVSTLSRTFHEPLMEIIKNVPRTDLPEHLTKLDAASRDFTGKAADIIMRDILNSIPGLVESDRLLELLVKTLRSSIADDGDREEEALEPIQEQDLYDIHALTLEEARRRGPDLGNKAKNLIYLKDRGLPVPAGVVLSARHTRDYQHYTDQASFLTVIRSAVRMIEARTGAEFGGIDRPLYLSVRSGSYPSMPGILSSILYCGMNARTLEAFIAVTNNPALGWDSYRRFIENYGTAVFGLDNEFFEQIVRDYARTHALNPEGPLDAAHLRAITGLYTEQLGVLGLAVPTDVYEQLRQCVRAVYASWESDRARQFRSATGTSAAWGTSVTLMGMVSGNQTGGGATVFFTRNPYTREPIIFGETREQASGSDLASGRKSGRPLSRMQVTRGRQSLEESDPGLYRLHQGLARAIEDAFDGLPQEVEVTFTRDAQGRPILYVLQTRRMEYSERLIDTFDEICRMESRVIGRGIGASGGALSGVASFAGSPGQAGMLSRNSGMPVILIRKTANTDDVSLMPVIGGIITASGGVTSHAAVLAQKFNIAAVVACADMNVTEDEKGRPYAEIGKSRVQEGTAISIDGATGLVFSGTCFRTVQNT